MNCQLQELNFDAVPGKSTLQMELEFDAFHKKHPEVYAVLCRLARAQMERGRKHLGIGALYERCRFEFGMGDKASVPHLNNNHRAFYSRLMMEKEPDLAGVFEVRKQRRDQPISTHCTP
jgi:hypothetical protein